MEARQSTVLSLPLLDQFSFRKFFRPLNKHLQLSNVKFSATPVTGGFSVKVPTAPMGTAPINGQSYVVLTGCNTTVTDDTVAAGPAIVEISNPE